MSEENFSSKSELEQKLIAGIHGAPEIKKEEKKRFLGEFRERIIKALTLEQVHEEGTYPEILDAIRCPKAKQLIISRKVDLDYARDYINLARQEGLAFTTVDDPDFKGPIALIISADEAVDIEEIHVKSREERLRSKGIPEAIINAKGKYLCRDCFELLEKIAPEEAAGFRQPTFWERLMGKRCVSCDEKS